ncbi:hypothetical protein GGS21DRAFT_376760 [Xylaria nigripes]|nr:hypothetical protein GGS21DRAFT_376760 [Xylaria nigripes]
MLRPLMQVCLLLLLISLSGTLIVAVARKVMLELGADRRCRKASQADRRSSVIYLTYSTEVLRTLHTECCSSKEEEASLRSFRTNYIQSMYLRYLLIYQALFSVSNSQFFSVKSESTHSLNISSL